MQQCTQEAVVINMYESGVGGDFVGGEEGVTEI